jgi:ArsR family transcriptional regulator
MNVGHISNLVNIDGDRYAPTMTRVRPADLDPDIRLLTALADPTRLAILRQLAESETCACDLTECCDVGQPTVSHHLRVLREAGIVISERRGQWIFYRVAPDVASRLGRIAGTLVPGGLVPTAELVAKRRAALDRTSGTPPVA